METDQMDIPLLRTKLYRPPAPADYVHRPLLLARLEKSSNQPLILVSAPAGYGKSTLVSCWLDACEKPSAWISLDESDNDLRQFLAYFTSALDSLFSEGVPDTVNLLKAPNLPPIPVLGTTLVNELDRMKQNFIVALDDIHRIREKSVHEFLDFLLRHPPRPMQLVMIGRRDPVLPIASLRARGLVTEIRMLNLAFSTDEGAGFLQAATEEHIQSATAEELVKKAEGWVTGLRLFVLAMRGREAPNPKILELKGTTRYIFDYLVSEVLDNQLPVIRHFLLHTALLDRFCVPLCDALVKSTENTGRPETDGWEFIRWLQQNNLFVIPLDAENRWFRYHHLFQDFLQEQLIRRCSAEEIATNHFRAGKWFEAEGLIEEALHHTLAAGDTFGAAQLVVKNRQSIFNTDQWYVLEKWLLLLPDAVVAERSELLLSRAWVALYHYRFEEIPSILEQVDKVLEDDVRDPSLHGEAAFFKGCIHFFQNDAQRSLKFLEDAVKQIPVSYHVCRGEAEVFLGLATQMATGTDQAIDNLNRLLNSSPPPHNLRKTRLMATSVYVHMISGNLDEAETANRILYEISANGRYAHPKAWSDYLQGLIHLYRYEIDPAVYHLEHAVKQRFIFDTRATVDSFCALVIAHQAGGRPEAAETALKGLREFIKPLNDPGFNTLADACGARFSVFQGNPGAFQPAGEAPMPEEVMLFWFEIPCVTFCRTLIAEGSTVNLRRAEKQLEKFATLNEAQHNTWQLVGIRSLLAMACEKQGKVKEARTALLQALSLAEPGGFIFPFVELGPPMAALLKQLRKTVRTDHMDKVLVAFRESETPSEPQTATHEGQFSQPAPQPLMEPLSYRELDVLELLRKRLQNKEIALELSISPLTVKSHLKSIYQKLSVEKRRQAVERAEELGILQH